MEEAKACMHDTALALRGGARGRRRRVEPPPEVEVEPDTDVNSSPESSGGETDVDEVGGDDDGEMEEEGEDEEEEDEEEEEEGKGGGCLAERAEIGELLAVVAELRGATAKLQGENRRLVEQNKLYRRDIDILVGIEEGSPPRLVVEDEDEEGEGEGEGEDDESVATQPDEPLPLAPVVKADLPRKTSAVADLRLQLAAAKRLKEEYRIRLVDLLAGAGSGAGAGAVLADLEKSRAECVALKRKLAAERVAVGVLAGKAGVPDSERGQVQRYYLERVEALAAEAKGLAHCDDVRAELKECKDALELLRAQNYILYAGLKHIVPRADPGGDTNRERELRDLGGRLIVLERERERMEVDRDLTNVQLKKKLARVVADAAKLKSEKVVNLSSQVVALRATIADGEFVKDPVRLHILDRLIAMLEAATAQRPSTAGLKKLLQYRTERVSLLPAAELRGFVIDLQNEAVPAIVDLPDSYFLGEWEGLFKDVQSWCGKYYYHGPQSAHLSYDSLVRSAHLLSFYLRDVLIHRNYVDRLVLGDELGPGRADVATGIVFRILVEEIFEPIRFLLHLRFPDPAERWKVKRQYKTAFETPDMFADAIKPRFQAHESFLQRKKRGLTEYPAPEIFENVPLPHKRVKSNLHQFNFLRTFEDDERPSVSRDNDDDMILNTARAKFMRTIFSLASDPTNIKFKVLRSDVSALITDTLRPLAQILAPPTATTSNPQAVPRPPQPSTTFAPDMQSHKQQLWKIIKRAQDLAITMRSQRTVIHPMCHDLMAMECFSAKSMTIANYPPMVSPRRRDEMDKLYEEASARSFGDGDGDPGVARGAVQCELRPVCEVLPVLFRRGDPAVGGYSWRERVVVSKARVYVGGPDDEGAQNGLRYTVATFPFGLD